MKCPACQTESSGAYCPECGTPLKSRCRACNASLPAGARFCTECGAAARRSRSNAPWYVAGAALLALIAVVLLPGASPSTAGGSAAQAPLLSGGADAAGAPAMDAGSPPPLTGTPREQADRLFNLIMENKEKGDTAKAKFFVPMGIQAYGMAGDLDDDGLYHLSLLQALGGSGRDAIATAEKILAKSPHNLLGLAAAAQGALAADDAASARNFYRQFLDAYPAESGRDLPEYREHTAALPAYRSEAQAYLAK